MCGIFSIFKSDDTLDAGDFSMTRRALEALNHRGPDSCGVASYKNVILGHARLAIVSPNGTGQPFQTATSMLAVNGEIYNYLELKKQFGWYNFMSGSDCEVIIPMMDNAIEKYYYGGDDGAIVDAIKSLDGIFAFVYYNRKHGICITARDAIGVIPLYIAENDKYTIFTSEVKALIGHPYENLRVREFLPAQVSINGEPAVRWIDLSTRAVSRFSNGAAGSAITNFARSCLTAEQPVDHARIRSLVSRAVKKRLMSDVPFALLISGGLDSSIIAACACDIMREGCPDRPIISFAIGLADSEDLVAARKVAAYLKTTHIEIVVSIEQVISELENAIYYLESFDVATVRSGVLMYILAKEISARGFKMVLGGDGADELFAGYDYFKYAPDADALFEECDRKLQSLHLYDCLRGNKSMMGGSIEYRVPFLDLDLIRYVHLELDPSVRLHRDGMEKYILRKAFEGALPDEILWRKKVQFSAGAGDDMIRALINVGRDIIHSDDFAMREKIYPIATPQTKEAMMYRHVFEDTFANIDGVVDSVSYYPSLNCSTAEANEWFPKELQGVMDPCGTKFAVM